MDDTCAAKPMQLFLVADDSVQQAVSAVNNSK
jgi:hypothetical protein